MPSVRLVIFAAAICVASPAIANDLNLVCAGGGSANKVARGQVQGWDSFGNYGSATVTGQRSQDFSDQVSIRINSVDPRIRMPRTMLPMLRGGNDGWFKLKDVQIKDTEITASAAVNPLNNPKIRIDRYTGAISISGKAGDFAGQCQAYDPSKVERAF